MSKRESIARYNLIINKLRKLPASFDEIVEYLKVESEIQSYNFNVSKRTFQRDLKDICSLYGIEIVYDRTNKVYFIDHHEQAAANERILEAYDTFNALSLTERLTEYIQFEPRRSLGTENLFGLLHAIKNKWQINFIYQSFNDVNPSKRRVEPYVLKEFRDRWYLLVLDLKDKQIKSFALDRLSELEITKIAFVHPKHFNIDKYYAYCFGIVGPNVNAEPEEVVLAFNPLQGNFIKSLPLHHSQEVLQDDDEALIVRLKLHITHDFIMEILSYGPDVKVINPVSLSESMRNHYLKALGQYQ